MSDDFNGLLNALRRGTEVSNAPVPQQPSVPNQWYISPNQPTTLPPAHPPYVVYQQPQQQPAVASSSSSYLNILIILLLLAIITFGIIAWMRMTKLETIPKVEKNDTVPVTKQNVQTNSEIRTGMKTDIRELPVPASITPLFESFPNDQDDEVSMQVTENLLDYIKPSKDVIDVDLDEIQLVEESKNYVSNNKRLVADESDEVKEYIKKRENLFKN